MTTTTTTSSSSTSSSSSSSGATCPTPCGTNETCCNGECVDTHNDIHNCGACGTTCAAGFGEGYCDDGKCGTPVCNPGHVCAGVQQCCGSDCCDFGQLCCNGANGSTPPTCKMPVNGTCPTN